MVPASDEPARLVNVRRFLMGIAADRSEDLLPLLAPDVVYTVPGNSSMSGVFRGPAQVHEHIDQLFRATTGTFEILKWVDWLLGLNHVAALQFAQAQGKGAVFRGHVVYVVETDRHDLLSNIRVFFEDQADADAFLGKLGWA
jgi:ketosteroid isomerase-like protein